MRMLRHKWYAKSFSLPGNSNRAVHDNPREPSMGRQRTKALGNTRTKRGFLICALSFLVALLMARTGYLLKILVRNTSSGLRDAPNEARCLNASHTWHLALIWGHGLNNSDTIQTILQDVPGVDIRFKKVVSVPRIEDLIHEVYKDEITRIGFEHIRAKTNYLKQVEPSVGVVVLSDSRPDLKTQGEGVWTAEVNVRVAEVKWRIRRELNPKPAEGATRDHHGVYSHDHVIHISDTSEGVDSVLSYLKQPSLAQLCNCAREKWARDTMIMWLSTVRVATPAVIFKMSSTFPDDFDSGNDIDVLVKSIPQAIASIRAQSMFLDINVNLLHNSSQAHVDGFCGVKFVRLDLYERFHFSFSGMGKVPEPDEVFAKSLTKRASFGDLISVPSLEHECELRWLEWKTWHHIRRDKIKHLHWNRFNQCAPRWCEYGLEMCTVQAPKGKEKVSELHEKSRDMETLAVNYGHVPHSKGLKNHVLGYVHGDDLLDCLIFGRSIDHGTEVLLNITGAFKIEGSGLLDWKIFGHEFGNEPVDNITTWNILQEWFSSYKHEGVLSGRSSRAEVVDILKRSTRAMLWSREKEVV